jgi:DNA-directed RNA polymerase beta subunit
LLSVILGREKEDERDNAKLKGVELAGPLLAGLTYQMVKKTNNDIRNSVQRFLDEGRPINIATYIKQKTITQRYRYNIATGNWIVTKSTLGGKTGVTAVLQRLSYAAALSHLDRLNTPIGK